MAENDETKEESRKREAGPAKRPSRSRSAEELRPPTPQELDSRQERIGRKRRSGGPELGDAGESRGGAAEEDAVPPTDCEEPPASSPSTPS